MYEFPSSVFKSKTPCFFCKKTGEVEAGYVGLRCRECGKISSDEASHMVYSKRMFLGLTRPEMAKLTGYSKHTIKQYEWVYCTKNYFELVKNLSA